MVNKAKTLGEYKKNLDEKLKNLPGSENLKKEYKDRLFREIVADPDYQKLRTEYLNEKRSEAVKEKIFQDAFSHARKINPSLTEEDFRAVLIGKTEKKEAKEKVEKSLEFEKETFKIDSADWREATKEEAEQNRLLNKFVGKSPKVKVNATGDVVEYIEWEAKWEQLFITYDVFLREVCKAKKCSPEEAEAKYLMTLEEINHKMADKLSDSESYKKFFNEEINHHIAGSWHKFTEEFYGISERSHVWLAGGNTANFNYTEWNQTNDNRNCGFSGRLLKN